MQVASLVYSALQSLVLAAWSRRRAIIFFISFNLMALSSSFRHYALVACRFLSYNMFWFRLPCKIIYLLLSSPHLCILLNLVILTIVVKSFALSTAKPADRLPVFQPVEHPNRLVDAPLGEHAAKIRVVSNIKWVEEIVRQQRPGLFTKDLSLEDTGRLILSSEEQEKVWGANDKERAAFSGDNTTVLVIIQKGLPSSDDLPPMEDPSRKVVAHAVVTEGRNAAERPDEQLDKICEREDNQVQHGEAESSDDESGREELNRRADAFILNFRRNLWLQRQESCRRRYGFASEGE